MRAILGTLAAAALLGCDPPPPQYAQYRNDDQNGPPQPYAGDPNAPQPGAPQPGAPQPGAPPPGSPPPAYGASPAAYGPPPPGYTSTATQPGYHPAAPPPPGYTSTATQPGYTSTATQPGYNTAPPAPAPPPPPAGSPAPPPPGPSPYPPAVAPPPVPVASITAGQYACWQVGMGGYVASNLVSVTLDANGTYQVAGYSGGGGTYRADMVALYFGGGPLNGWVGAIGANAKGPVVRFRPDVPNNPGREMHQGDHLCFLHF